MACTLQGVIAIFLHVLNRIEFLDVADDSFHLPRRIAQPRQPFRHSAIDNLEQAAAGQQLVFHQRNVRLDAGCVTVHQKSNCARRRKYCYLCIPVTRLLSFFERALPTFARLFLQIIEFGAWLNCLYRILVLLDNTEH